MFFLDGFCFLLVFAPFQCMEPSGLPVDRSKVLIALAIISLERFWPCKACSR